MATQLLVAERHRLWESALLAAGLPIRFVANANGDPDFRLGRFALLWLDDGETASFANAALMQRVRGVKKTLPKGVKVIVLLTHSSKQGAEHGFAQKQSALASEGVSWFAVTSLGAVAGAIAELSKAETFGHNPPRERERVTEPARRLSLT